MHIKQFYNINHPVEQIIITISMKIFSDEVDYVIFYININSKHKRLEINDFL